MNPHTITVFKDNNSDDGALYIGMNDLFRDLSKVSLASMELWNGLLFDECRRNVFKFAVNNAFSENSLKSVLQKSVLKYTDIVILTDIKLGKTCLISQL